MSLRRAAYVAPICTQRQGSIYRGQNRPPKLSKHRPTRSYVWILWNVSTRGIICDTWKALKSVFGRGSAPNPLGELRTLPHTPRRLGRCCSFFLSNNSPIPGHLPSWPKSIHAPTVSWNPEYAPGLGIFRLVERGRAAAHPLNSANT